MIKNEIQQQNKTKQKRNQNNLTKRKQNKSKKLKIAEEENFVCDFALIVTQNKIPFQSLFSCGYDNSPT